MTVIVTHLLARFLLTILYSASTGLVTLGRETSVAETSTAGVPHAGGGRLRHTGGVYGSSCECERATARLRASPCSACSRER